MSPALSRVWRPMMQVTKIARTMIGQQGEPPAPHQRDDAKPGRQMSAKPPSPTDAIAAKTDADTDMKKQPDRNRESEQRRGDDTGFHRQLMPPWRQVSARTNRRNVRIMNGTKRGRLRRSS